MGQGVSVMTMTDRDQIQERMARYANAIDAKDYGGIAACFLPGATVDYAGFTQPLQGIDPIITHMRHSLEPLDAMQHIFGNFIIDIAGDAARLTCDILAQHIRQGLQGGDSFMAGGKYDVRLRKVDGNWKFETISARTVWGSGNRDLLPKAGDAG